MKYLIIALTIILSSSLAFSQDTPERFVIYSTSAPYNGKEMVVEFGHNEIMGSPICETSDKEFPIKQSDAISRVLDWAKEKYGSLQSSSCHKGVTGSVTRLCYNSH